MPDLKKAIIIAGLLSLAGCTTTTTTVPTVTSAADMNASTPAAGTANQPDFPTPEATAEMASNCAGRALERKTAHPVQSIYYCKCISTAVAKTPGEWYRLKAAWKQGALHEPLKSQFTAQHEACMKTVQANYGLQGQEITALQRSYVEQASNVVAGWVQKFRVQEEAEQTQTAGHPVPLPTGVCVATVSLGDDGSVIDGFPVDCTDAALETVVRRAVMAASPLTPAPGDKRITVTAKVVAPLPGS